jgi:hypothetical protein
LVARTARIGWTVAALLVACVVAEVSLAEGWLFSDARVTLLVVSALATVIALVAGIVTEGHRAGVRSLRAAGIRGVLGLCLSVLYCTIGLSVVLLVIFLVSMNGPPASTPSAAGVLPLPTALAVAADVDEGCGSGSQTICSRQIQVRSTTHQTEEEVAQQLRDHLARVDGLQLTQDASGGWGDCRAQGWLLDRHQVCVDIQNDHGQVVVLLESSDSW